MNPEQQHSSARVLAMRLSRVLNGFLEGRLDPEQVAVELKKVTAWIESGHQPKKGKESKPTDNEAVRRLFDFWVERANKDPEKTKLTSIRRDKLVARLKVYPEADIRRAIVNVTNDPFYMGKNDKKTPYNDLELICRHDHMLEKFRDLAPASVDIAQDHDERAEDRERLKAAAARALKEQDYDAYNEANRALSALSGR